MTRNEILITLQHMPAGAQWLLLNDTAGTETAEKINPHTVALHVTVPGMTGRDTFRYTINQAATIIYQDMHS